MPPTVVNLNSTFDWSAEIRQLNPLGSVLDQSGLWYKVQMLDGTQGWIFAEPQGHEGPPIARSFAAQNVASPEPSEFRNVGTPKPSDKRLQAQQVTPSLGEALLKPLSDPQVSTTQRVGRGIGMVIGGTLAALFLIGAFGVLLLTAGGGWRWWWWRERVRRIRDSRPFSWHRRGGQSSSQTT